MLDRGFRSRTLSGPSAGPVGSGDTSSSPWRASPRRSSVRDLLDGGVRQGAQAEWPEIGRELFIAMQPRNLFDEIHLSSQVGTPARSFHRDTPILRLGDKRGAHRHEIVLERLPWQLHAEELRDPRRPQEDPRRVGGTGTYVDRSAHQLATGSDADDLDAAPQRLDSAPAVDAALEAIACLGGEPQRSPRPPDAGGVK